MTTETVQEVLWDMRRIAAIQPQEFADRIERALAESEAVAWQVRMQTSGGEWYPWASADSEDDARKRVSELLKAGYPQAEWRALYATQRPAIGNKPAVDEAMVERACRSYHGDRWLRMEYKDSPRRWMRATLTAALIDSALDGKGGVMRKPPYYICVLFAVTAIYGAAIEEAWISALMAVFASALLAYAFYVVEEITK